MSKTFMEALVEEFREGYQVPSYISDSACETMLNESMDFFKALADEDVKTDSNAMKLVKERAFYDYNHQLGQFMTDYVHEVVSWQMSKAGAVLE